MVHEALKKMVHFVAGSAGKLGFTRLSMFYPVIEPAINHGKH
jgi:hypothetical protein